MKRVSLAVIALFFSACSLTREVPPPVTYHLQIDRTIETSSEQGCRERVMRIALIQSPQWLKGTDIFYSDAHRKLYRYTKARWEQAPANQLQHIIENAVTEAGLYKGVIPYKSLAKNDWLLEIRLEQMMQQIADDGSAKTVLKLYAVLIDQYSRQILAQKKFHYTDESAQGNAQTAVAAWSHASGELQKDMTSWLADECQGQSPAKRSDIDI